VEEVDLIEEEEEVDLTEEEEEVEVVGLLV
jgi:hypothetical protein